MQACVGVEGLNSKREATEDLREVAAPLTTRVQNTQVSTKNSLEITIIGDDGDHDLRAGRKLMLM
jgi:hypothetical protein